MATISLSTLYPDSRFTITNLNNPGVVIIANTSMSVSNGGVCCLWTVPANATWARFEVWGGGGGGGGACCCQFQSCSASSGSYARKTIRLVPGQTYTICAGGSTSCMGSCLGQPGFASYACNPSATYPLCLCASGGISGSTTCGAGYSYSCLSRPCAGSACGFDLAICAVSHGIQAGGGCGFHSWGLTPDPTYVGGGAKISPDACRPCIGVCGGFPGGAGGNGNGQGGSCCWGSWGAPGLVVITYK